LAEAPSTRKAKGFPSEWTSPLSSRYPLTTNWSFTSYRYYGSGWELRLNSKGQVKIPAPLRKKDGLREGDEGNVLEDGFGLRIIPVDSGQSRGQRLVNRMRGRASAAMSRDLRLPLLRGE